MYFVMEDGTQLDGRTRSSGKAYGEAVFTTAYTGYEESITDPSYTGQILVFSYPLIGNYGVDNRRFESHEPTVEGVVAREMTDEVAEWLRDNDVPAIDHVDTRHIVTSLREKGAMGAALQSEEGFDYISETPSFSERKDHILNEVELEQSVKFEGGDVDVAFIDCGAKQNIIDEFRSRGAVITRWPHSVSENKLLNQDPDLIFISNGPGDPEWFEQPQEIVKKFAGDVPIAGICLGQQVVALALGGSTEKMEFGHRGVNQPVFDRRTEQVRMTTQNHGYEVSDPGPLDPVQHNVNDESLEGLESKELKIITRQYHPEACPGPRDNLDFFDNVLALARDETLSAFLDE